MPDMRYFEAKDKFLDYSWEVFVDYYDDRSDFESQFDQIPTDEDKNLFLKIASFYKFLVRDGRFVIDDSNGDDDAGYFDETYKFIAIMAFIETLYGDQQYIDFFQWLNMRKRRAEVFPIPNNTKLELLYDEYKQEYGASRKAENFFSSLDSKARNFLSARITIADKYEPVEELAKLMYTIRSEFVHSSRLILEFIRGGMLSRRRKKQIYSIIEFKDLMLLFEEGLLTRFSFAPDNRKI
jgi:hypothetical protein